MAGELTEHGDSTSAAQWRARLDRFAKGRQTVAAFCAAERVSVPAYYYWRKRLGSEGLPAAHASRSFIDVGPVRADSGATVAAAAPVPGLEVRLDLGGGLLLHIVRH
jgi:putative transposase